MRNIKEKIESVSLHMPWLKPVYHDLYDICNRIRNIEDGYFIMRNVQTKKYEVHNADTKGSTTYEFTVPFDALDSRTLDHCVRTRASNTEKLLAEIEANNRKIEESKKRKFFNDSESRAIELANDLRRAT